jgi:hypothetical protein
VVKGGDPVPVEILNDEENVLVPVPEENMPPPVPVLGLEDIRPVPAPEVNPDVADGNPDV